MGDIDADTPPPLLQQQQQLQQQQPTLQQEHVGMEETEDDSEGVCDSPVVGGLRGAGVPSSRHSRGGVRPLTTPTHTPAPASAPHDGRVLDAKMMLYLAGLLHESHCREGRYGTLAVQGGHNAVDKEKDSMRNVVGVLLFLALFLLFFCTCPEKGSYSAVLRESGSSSRDSWFPLSSVTFHPLGILIVATENKTAVSIGALGFWVRLAVDNLFPSPLLVLKLLVLSLLFALLLFSTLDMLRLALWRLMWMISLCWFLPAVCLAVGYIVTDWWLDSPWGTTFADQCAKPVIGWLVQG